MDTVVDIQVATERSKEEAEAAIERAFSAFRKVEDACSRFHPDSELVRACRRIGVPVPIGPYLFEPLKFALELADWSIGVFDPAVGGTMEKRGFNRRYLTGEIADNPADDSATYQDIELDAYNRTLLLRKPMVIDLGAVAKGFAIDLAARELSRFERFIVNAGGDLFAGGADGRNNAWNIGIRHPERRNETIQTIEISNEAICTSGSYERISAAADGVHHIVDPRTKRSPNAWVSCSVVAPYAMLADAISTAAFLLKEEEAPYLLERAELRGVFIKPDLRIVKVGGM